jgi:pimeloyl-ACP methyl ester carboxylesterase
MKELTIDVAGTSLRCTEAGSGPTVLYLHGMAGAGFDPLLERLAGKYRVVAPEHPGFGRGPIPDWMMGVGDVAFFYLDALKALDLRDVHLVGHDLGGWIAAEVAIRDTHRLASLALLAPAGLQSAQAPFDDVFAWSAEEFAQRQFHDPDQAAQWQRRRAELAIDVVLQNQTAVARLAWNPRLCNPQLRCWLHRIDVPTLLVWGEEDRVIPLACHEGYRREIPRAELAVLPRCGHALPIEHADAVADRLANFFKGAESFKGAKG